MGKMVSRLKEHEEKKIRGKSGKMIEISKGILRPS